MMLDFEDLTAIRDLIDRAERRAAAGAIRVQAHEHHEGRQEYAAALYTLADDVEVGVLPVPSGPVKMLLVPEDAHDSFLDRISQAALAEDDAAVAEEEGEARVPEIATVGTQLVPFAGGECSEAELAWLDLFDDRLRSSPHFIEAVNEAAEHAMPLSPGSAALVGERIRELTACAESTPAAEQVEDEAAPPSRGMRARTPEPAPNEPEEA